MNTHMIHILKSDGTGLWLPEDEFKRKYPDLWKAMEETQPHSDLGIEMRHHRQEYDVSLSEMARKTGIPASDLSAYERGCRLAPDAVLKAYAELGKGKDQ